MVTHQEKQTPQEIPVELKMEKLSVSSVLLLSLFFILMLKVIYMTLDLCFSGIYLCLKSCP